MSKKKSQLDQFSRLTWNDIDGGLIAWVDGSERYATKVVMDTGR